MATTFLVRWTFFPTVSILACIAFSMLTPQRLKHTIFLFVPNFKHRRRCNCPARSQRKIFALAPKCSIATSLRTSWMQIAPCSSGLHIHMGSRSSGEKYLNSCPPADFTPAQTTSHISCQRAPNTLPVYLPTQLTMLQCIRRSSAWNLA